MSNVTGITFDMICEVSAETFNFLTYDEYDWTYPYVFETGIKYATSLTVKKPDYSASFEINNIKDGDDNSIAIKGSSSNGGEADTFGLLKFTDAQGNQWTITQTDFKVIMPNGQEGSRKDRVTGTNDIGEKIKYLQEPIVVNDGVISRVYLKLNEIKIDYVNGTSKTYVRYHTMIFKKLYQSINSLAIVDDYYLSEEDEAALIADTSKYLATVSLTNNEGKTTTVDFYSITARKAYIVVNGEGGYYVSMGAVQKIFENSEKFFNCQDIK